MNHIKHCAACGKAFEAKRHDAQTCGSACRKRLSRKESSEDTVKKLYEAAHSEIMGLVGYSGDRDPMISLKAQKRLQVLCIEILQYAPEKVRQDVYQQLASSVTG